MGSCASCASVQLVRGEVPRQQDAGPPRNRPRKGRWSRPAACFHTRARGGSVPYLRACGALVFNALLNSTVASLSHASSGWQLHMADLQAGIRHRARCWVCHPELWRRQGMGVCLAYCAWSSTLRGYTCLFIFYIIGHADVSIARSQLRVWLSAGRPVWHLWSQFSWVGHQYAGALIVLASNIRNPTRNIGWYCVLSRHWIKEKTISLIATSPTGTTFLFHQRKRWPEHLTFHNVLEFNGKQNSSLVHSFWLGQLFGSFGENVSGEVCKFLSMWMPGFYYLTNIFLNPFVYWLYHNFHNATPLFYHVAYALHCLIVQACNAHGIYCVPLYDTLGKLFVSTEQWKFFRIIMFPKQIVKSQHVYTVTHTHAC
jgi:hypothetical protein